ncbi:OmpA family protein [Autumnicola edwardsiae]|uniref:OmpA family protein n=1 Tax=Autumnicola edwardsiae TaxID=3075594 RepID=A0ABU3CRE3_9FLAO|nr:OmpA family protein [Zunongwangia sp. F297]MDT0648917.1 OmpA family protein [Zunongwangia sp. F297]
MKFYSEYKLLTLGILLIIFPNICAAQAQMEHIAAGSYLINMGVSPQTSSNALKPYGLLYDLLKNEQVEVKWVINPEKEKDGIDFTHENINFRSSSFVVPVSYITEDVKQKIENWQKKGVTGIFAVSNLKLPVYTTLSIAPKWTLDKQNGDIALPFFDAAEIPAEAFGGRKSVNWKNPSELGVCDDIFVMPHAQPRFESHRNIYYWNRDFKGAIWAGCHAGSQLENLVGLETLGDKKKPIQLNFLSAGYPGAGSAGLIPYHKHRHATPPYAHLQPADPVSQYLGDADNAHLNGSERVFYPKDINLWRPGVKKIVIDPSAPDNPSLTKAEAAIVVYGHGFDNPENGLVMYQAGHSIFGTSEEHIAAMRTFFNWSFYAAEVKREQNLVKFENQDFQHSVVAARIGDDLAKILKLKNINFDLDKAEIKAEAKKELDRIADFMNDYPELLMDVRSHTDCRADDGYNQKLSEARVEATMDYLLDNGLDQNRISGRGYGETEILNDCTNGVSCHEKQHEVNRRSEFILSIDCSLYSGRLKQNTK